ncbi:MAG: FdtA/QdtA family cupin domain-containing protein [Candidatus Sericytochromatia bacterium]
MKNIEIINFEIKGDSRGSLISIENLKNIPFDIKRIYYIFNTLDDVIRGKHAHKKLEQVLICLSGSCYIDLDTGIEKTSFLLDSPQKGLYIKDMVWREMRNFSSNTVLLVLASDFYNENDYIRNYESFILETNKLNGKNS